MKKQNKMDCQEINKDLIFYAEGSLSGERKDLVEAHLHECTDCSRFLIFIKESLFNIETHKQDVEDAFFFTRVSQRLNNKENGSSIPLQRFFSNLAAAALFTGVIISGISLGRLFKVNKVNNYQAMKEEIRFLDELKQEPIESYFLTFNEYENE